MPHDDKQFPPVPHISLLWILGLISAVYLAMKALRWLKQQAEKEKAQQKPAKFEKQQQILRLPYSSLRE